MLKLSYTTAFTVSMLSWAYFEFRSGYTDTNNGDMVSSEDARLLTPCQL